MTNKRSMMRRCFLFILGSVRCQSLGADQIVAQHHLLKEWNTDVEQLFKDRLVTAPTVNLLFNEILTLPATQRLLAEQKERNIIERQILSLIVERCKKDHLEKLYAEGGYSYLFCLLKGISPNSLLVIAGAHEQVLDFVVAAIFAKGELDRSLWWKEWKLLPKKMLPRLLNDDPFSAENSK